MRPLREIAFDERAKIHDLVLEGIELAILETRTSIDCGLEGQI